MIFFLSFLLVGCSVQSPLIQIRPSISQLLVERPPSRIIYTGKMSEAFVIHCLQQMQDDEFEIYDFNENTTLETKAGIVEHKKYEYPAQNMVQ